MPHGARSDQLGRTIQRSTWNSGFARRPRTASMGIQTGMGFRTRSRRSVASLGGWRVATAATWPYLSQNMNRFRPT